jgi:hypothetical protein
LAKWRRNHPARGKGGEFVSDLRCLGRGAALAIIVALVAVIAACGSGGGGG